MHLVAIAAPSGATDGLGDELARVTGLSVYEARTRLRVLGAWPGVLATYGEERDAGAVAASVETIGIDSWVLRGDVGEPRATVRRYTLRAGVLAAVADGAEAHEVDLSAVRLLLSGRRYTERHEHHVERTHAGASYGLGIAALPSSGNPHPVSRRTESSEAFLHLYAPGRPALVFAEASVQYAAIQPGALEPTRKANFGRVVRQLRAVCDNAVWDDRLGRRQVQARLLGPTLRPERHLDVAIALLTRQLGATSNPYR